MHQVVIEELVIVWVQLRKERMTQQFEAICPLCRVFDEASIINKVKELWRELAAHRVLNLRSWFLFGSDHNTVQSHSLVRVGTYSKLIGNNTQTPNVGKLVVRLCDQNLWGHPLRCAFNLLLVVLILNELCSKTEVTKLDFTVCC